MLAEMRPSELGHWRALYEVDPWGEERADLRVAQVALNVARAGLKKESGEPFTLLDFMPFAERPKKPSSLAQKIKGFLMGHSKKKGA